MDVSSVEIFQIIIRPRAHDYGKLSGEWVQHVATSEIFIPPKAKQGLNIQGGFLQLIL